MDNSQHVPTKTPANPDKPGLMDVPAAAGWLGVSVSWLEKAVANRKVPHTRIGRNVRFSQTHLDEIVRRNEVAPVYREKKSGRTGARTSL